MMQRASCSLSASSDVVVRFSPGMLQAGSQPEAPYFLLRVDARGQDESRVATYDVDGVYDAQAKLLTAQTELLAAKAKLQEVSESKTNATCLTCIAAHASPGMHQHSSHRQHVAEKDSSHSGQIPWPVGGHAKHAACANTRKHGSDIINVLHPQYSAITPAVLCPG